MTGLLTERNRLIISGAVGLLLVLAATTIGIKASFGAFDGGYHVHGTFAAAGQGLRTESDVKIRGVDVGEVSGIELVDNRAEITMRINDGVQVPVTVQAVIRPKTLFGEKFVDLVPGDDEGSGPYLQDGDEIENTLGGFELEQVLTDAYPILDAIDPAELAVVLDELANAGDGLGENINRSIVNGATLSDLAVSNDAEFRQFTHDFALVSEALEKVSPDLVRGAKDLNAVLPTINDRSDQLNTALVKLAELSGDVADLLEQNEDFTTDALTKGSKALQVVYDRRSQIQPLLLGVTHYTRTIAEAIRIEVGDGTLMAAVKNLVAVGTPDAPISPPVIGGGDGPLGGLPLPLPDLPLPSASTDSGDPVTDPLLDLLTGGGA